MSHDRSARAGEHRQSGRWIAQFAGSAGAQCPSLSHRGITCFLVKLPPPQNAHRRATQAV